MSSSTMQIFNPVVPNDLFSAKGLVIVITGGGTGIGLAFTAALAASGASRIFILGRRLPVLESAAASTNPSIVTPIQCDISSLPSIRSAAASIASQTPYIDVLINNAGIDGPPHKDIRSATSLSELSDIMLRDWELWNPAWEVNTAAIIGCAGAFLELLGKGNERRGWVGMDGKVDRKRERKVEGMEAEGVDTADQRTSQIITTASISAFNREVTAGLAYTASKAGAVALGKTLANLLAGWGIRSNMVCPGRFPSQLTAGAATEFPVSQIPHGTPGSYEDLASTILYLVGRSGQYVNGAVQVVDGGRLSMMPATF